MRSFISCLALCVFWVLTEKASAEPYRSEQIQVQTKVIDIQACVNKGNKLDACVEEARRILLEESEKKNEIITVTYLNAN